MDWIEAYASLKNVRDLAEVVQSVGACELAHRDTLNRAWVRKTDWDYWMYRFRDLEFTHVKAGRQGAEAGFVCF